MMKTIFRYDLAIFIGKKDLTIVFSNTKQTTSFDALQIMSIHSVISPNGQHKIQNI